MKGLFKYMGYFLSACAVVTVIFTWGVNHERKVVKDTSVSNKVDRLIESDSLRNVQMIYFQASVMDSISHISHQLRRQKDEFQKTKVSLDNLRIYMINNAATKEDMVEVLNIWDIKKNLNFNGTALR